ncbi:MAG: ATP-binding cassette domain-containing protein [Clostridium sulfidigenes]|uniref:ATP-binding cassette domain-containing protein n=1 Tax=Clostridium sulfidigenes TaxID=318464 RepID=A0A927ZKV5_9CLOT|nr:ATP-binding cassette domain-containing protein [Clostridium sulfidigenes]
MGQSYIELKNVTKEINGNLILSNINLNLDRGKIYGIKGKNGSGKTMLFRAICGFIRTDGSVIVDGKAIGKDGSYPDSIGVLLENPGFLPNYSGFKNLKYLAEINNKINDNDITNILKEVGLDPTEKKSFRKYSLGMKQKLGIAQAIMENPDVVILDEPTNALDEESVKKINSMIVKLKNDNKLVLISNHNRDELEMICDEIYSIENGKIYDHMVIREENNNEKEE